MQTTVASKFGFYHAMPHLCCPVALETDPPLLPPLLLSRLMVSFALRSLSGVAFKAARDR